VEDCIGLPSLPDLLNELDRDVDIESLEELTQSLLQDIAADLEAAAQKTNCEEPNVGGQDGAGKVVGSSSENLESGRCDSIKTENGLEQEISPFLLLHHDYSAKQDTQAPGHKLKQEITHKSKKEIYKPSRKIKNTKLNTKTKLKRIMPKTAQSDCNLETFYIDSSNVSIDGSEVLYGTLDESTNCITIIVNDDSLHLGEAVTEITTTDEEEEDEISETCPDQTIVLNGETNNVETLQLPCKSISEDGLSPAYSSDYGYESFDSPHSVDEIEIDVWDKSVSELFPMLL